LLSDIEAEQQEKERADQLARIQEVKIRFRFPDQSSVDATFGTEVSGSELYRYATGLIEAESEPFKLSYRTDNGPAAIVPEDGRKLIKDLKLKGSVIVTFLWGDDARESIRKLPTLKPQYRDKAKDIPVAQVPEAEEQDAKNVPDNKGKGKDDEKPNKKGSSGESNFKNKFLRFGKK
jgi:tether containing UBX domain for GLUT4